MGTEDAGCRHQSHPVVAELHYTGQETSVHALMKTLDSVLKLIREIDKMVGIQQKQSD